MGLLVDYSSFAYYLPEDIYWISGTTRVGGSYIYRGL
jgi:hypothetical protein